MRVVVADDHSIVRDSLNQYVRLLADAVHVDEAESLSQLLALSPDPNIDIILLDLHMPGMRGAANVSDVREAFPRSRIVVVSANVNKPVITEALRRGANGYVPKTTHGQALVNALRLVLAGETYIPPALLDTRSAPDFVAEPAAAPGAKLSPREAEVLTKLIAGETNRTIAAGLGLQDATVKVHIRNIYRKIGAANRVDAINIILKSGGVEAWASSE